MSELYEGCWHKLDWAKKHVDAFKRSALAWGASFDSEPPFGFRKEFDAHSNCFSVFVVDIADVPTEWSLMIGDALTNFRAALDYLAHDLVGRGDEPHHRGTSKPQFVICRNSKDFEGQIKGRMPGIRTAHKAIIKGYQPYRWLTSKDLHPFSLLDDLVRRDKHREIEPVFSQHSGQLQMSVVKKTNFAVSHVEPGRFYQMFPLPARLETNAEILRVFGQVTGPDPQVEVRLKSAIAIAFESGVWAADTLDQIGAMIAQLFAEIEPAL